MRIPRAAPVSTCCLPCGSQAVSIMRYDSSAGSHGPEGGGGLSASPVGSVDSSAPEGSGDVAPTQVMVLLGA